MENDKKPFDFKTTYANDPAFRQKVDAGRLRAQQNRDSKLLKESLKRIANKRY